MRRSSRDIDSAIAEMQSAEVAALRERWRAVIGRPAPHRISRDLLIRVLAYKIQEAAEGGLSAVTRRRLARLAADYRRNPDALAAPTPRIKPGTRLIREWRGETHEAIVLDNGIAYRGKRYGSLSEVARTITGVRWSGPVFFGLKTGKADGR